jgi:LemA protein
VVFEQYPDLKANQNALQLQEEIVNTENKLTFSKQAYNDSIEKYNAKKKSFFEAMIVNFFSSSLDKTFEYWALPEDQIKAHEDYTVKF